SAPHTCETRRHIDTPPTAKPGPLRDRLAVPTTSRLEDTQYRSFRVHASVTVVERAMTTPPVDEATLPAFTPMGTPCMQPISKPRAMRALLFTAVVLGMVHSGIEAADQEPQIFNGIPTADYPALAGLTIQFTGSLGLCSGTLIAPTVVLTAAHSL